MAEVLPMADVDSIANRLGIDLNQVDLESIHLPPSEDFGIPRYNSLIFAVLLFFFSSFQILIVLHFCSDDEEAIRHEDSLEFESGFGNIIVVDNLPVVPPEKFEKLEGVIRKIYSQIGVVKEDGLWMPVNPDSKKTLGYCFIEYNTPQVFLVTLLI